MEIFGGKWLRWCWKGFNLIGLKFLLAYVIFYTDGVLFFFMNPYNPFGQGIEWGEGHHNFRLARMIRITILLLMRNSTFLGHVSPVGRNLILQDLLSTNLFSLIRIYVQKPYILTGGVASSTLT